MENKFELKIQQLIDIAENLQQKIETGLQTDGMEIMCLPTYIHPKKDGITGEATVFDLGGTNFRAAVISVGDETVIKEIKEASITEMKNKGFTRDQLFNAQLKVINQLELPSESAIGYCFSYPATSLSNGDAILVQWSKGVNIPNMIGVPVGEPLVGFLNKHTESKFLKIAVVNDTITSLFAGLKNPGFDAYIGLIVGTGTNMAAFFPSEYIPKIREMNDWSGETPVNLETGNFNPPHLTSFDEKVDADSDNKGFQRFEKAISGMYLGRVFRAAFPNDDIDVNIDAAGLSRMMNHPEAYKQEHVDVAFQIYSRSAKLVAASIAGLLCNLNSAYPTMKRVQVLAEGSLFWSKVKVGNTSYVGMVEATLSNLLEEMGLKTINVQISSMENANLIGAAMAVLS